MLYGVIVEKSLAIVRETMGARFIARAVMISPIKIAESRARVESQEAAARCCNKQRWRIIYTQYSRRVISVAVRSLYSNLRVYATISFVSFFFGGYVKIRADDRGFDSRLRNDKVADRRARVGEIKNEFRGLIFGATRRRSINALNTLHIMPLLLRRRGILKLYVC